MRSSLSVILLVTGMLIGCDGKEEIDLLLYNGKIATLDSVNTVVEAVAISNGLIVAVGDRDGLLEQYAPREEWDAEGKNVYPGLIDSHCHFYGYGLQVTKVDLTGTSSFDDVVKILQQHHRQNPSAAWLTGRGWDQNDWEVKEWPSKTVLDSLFPDIPILIRRVDGHAALANSKALNLAGLDSSSKVEGGSLMVKDGELTGILIDNAVDLVLQKIPAPTREEMTEALLAAQEDCFAVGLTTVVDAGLSKEVVLLMDSLHKSGDLLMRVYAMLEPSKENKEYFLEKGIYKTDRLHVRSFKVYADGALGSRGARLLHHYDDAPNEKGFLLTSPDDMRELAELANEHGFQVNTHCIGDSANRLVLQLYGDVLDGRVDSRWRIEHAQVVNAADIPLFGKYGIIPSVQPTHATSDMYWAEERLGAERVKDAYAYERLYRSAGIVVLGSDFPVEHINPLYGYHAAVARQDAENYPVSGFQKEEALERETALRGMTSYGAYAAFEENEKGSIEVGKVADMVILDQDLLSSPYGKLREAKVVTTIVGGKPVYSAK